MSPLRTCRIITPHTNPRTTHKPPHVGAPLVTPGRPQGGNATAACMRPPSGRHECRPYIYPTFITSHTAGISPPPPGRHECRPYVYPTFITRHQPARPAFRRRHPGDMNVAPTFITRLSHATNPRGRRRALLLYMCPYDYEGGPCIPVLPRKKEKTGGNAFFFNFYS